MSACSALGWAGLGFMFALLALCRECDLGSGECDVLYSSVQAPSRIHQRSPGHLPVAGMQMLFDLANAGQARLFHLFDSMHTFNTLAAYQ